jgi:hypothetical protein
MHILIVPCFFFTSTTEKKKALELGMMCPISSNLLYVLLYFVLEPLWMPVGVVIMGFDPYSSSMTCSNPLSGGLPIGNGSNTFSCFPRNAWISKVMLAFL